jgi:hypothetical protein
MIILRAFPMLCWQMLLDRTLFGISKYSCKNVVLTKYAKSLWLTKPATMYHPCKMWCPCLPATTEESSDCNRSHIVLCHFVATTPIAANLSRILLLFA